MRDCPSGKATSALPEKGILSQSLPQSCYLKLGKSFKEHFSCCSMLLFLIRDKSREVQNSHCCKNQPMVLPLKTSSQICPRKLKRIAQATLNLIFPNFHMFGFATWGFCMQQKSNTVGKNCCKFCPVGVSKPQQSRPKHSEKSAGSSGQPKQNYFIVVFACNKANFTLLRARG